MTKIDKGVKKVSTILIMKLVWFFKKKKIRDGKMALEEEKRNQHKFKSDLNEIKKERHKSNVQKNALYNIETFCSPQNSVVKLFNDYSTIAYDVKHISFHCEGLKILTPKRLLQ